MKAEISDAIVNGDAPLAINAEIANEIHVDAATHYTLMVKLNRDEPTNVAVQIELPALVTLADTLIVAIDANGKRPLASQITAGNYGGVRLNFTDRLSAGAENQYRLSIRFSSAPKSVLQINAAVSEEGGQASINSATFFQPENGAVKERGAFQASKALNVAPVVNRED